jgi:hypothetical protein
MQSTNYIPHSLIKLMYLNFEGDIIIKIEDRKGKIGHFVSVDDITTDSQGITGNFWKTDKINKT